MSTIYIEFNVYMHKSASVKEWSSIYAANDSFKIICLFSIFFKCFLFAFIYDQWALTSQFLSHSLCCLSPNRNHIRHNTTTKECMKNSSNLLVFVSMLIENKIIIITFVQSKRFAICDCVMGKYSIPVRVLV